MNVDSVFLPSPKALYSYAIKTGKDIKYRSYGNGVGSGETLYCIVMY